MIKITTPHMTEVITDTVRSNAWALQNPGLVSRMVRDSSTPGHCDIDISPLRLKFSVVIGTTVSPTRMGIQEIFSPHRSTSYLEVGNSQVFNTSINGNSAEDGDSTPIFSKVTRRKLSHNSSIDIYSRCRVNFTSNAIRTEIPEFMHLGIPDVNALDELRSFCDPDTRVRTPADVSNWSALVRVFKEVAADGMSGTTSEKNYSSITDFETRKENQDFGRQNISMSRPPLDSTPFGTNTTNRKPSPIDSRSVRTKTTDPTPLTQPTYSQTLTMVYQMKKGKHRYQRTRSHTHHRQTHHQENLISLMTSIAENLKSRTNLIRTKDSRPT